MNIRKTALIADIIGQDGSYLAELLLKNGYIVHGLSRKFHHRMASSNIVGSEKNNYSTSW